MNLNHAIWWCIGIHNKQGTYQELVFLLGKSLTALVLPYLPIEEGEQDMYILTRILRSIPQLCKLGNRFEHDGIVEVLEHCISCNECLFEEGVLGKYFSYRVIFMYHAFILLFY